MNFGGLGFTFSAVDKGLKGALSATYTGFANVGKAVAGFGKVARDSLTGMSDVLKPFGADALDAMKSSAEDFTGALKSGMKGAMGAVVGVSKKLGDFVVSGVRGFGELLSRVGSLTASLASRALTSGLQSLGRGVASTAQQAVGAIQGLTAAPTNLTTGMEAAMQHHAESARRIGVNYGFLGAELNQFTRRAAGMADSLNISDEQAAMAVRGFQEAGAEFRAVGITSANMLARFSAVTGASADLMRNSLLQGRREFGMNNEQLQTLMHSTVAFGRYSGDVTGALNGMTETMQHLRQAAAQSGVELSPERMRLYTIGTQRAAAALFTFSQNSDDARQGANQIAASLLGAERQIQGLLAGTQDDLPALASELGIATGDIQRSFSLMQSGPDGFMTGLTQMVTAARATGRPMGAAMNQLLQRLTGAMDEQGANRIMTFVQQSMAQGTEGVNRAMAQMGETQNLRAMAAAHSTGRTMQEEFDRMNERFTMGFRSLSRGAVGPFMRDTQAAFTQFNSSLRAVVQEGGPLGELVQRLSMVHQMGALALLPPDARPFAAAFGSVANSMAPAVTALGSMGFRLGMLLNPLSLVAIAIGFVGVQFAALFLRTRNAGTAFAMLQERVAGFVRQAVSFVERLVPMVVQAIPMVLSAIMRIVQIAAPAALRIGVAILNGLVQIGASLVRWAARFDWSGFVMSLVRGLIPVLQSVAGLSTVLFRALLSIFESIDYTALASMLAGVVTRAVTALGRIDLGRSVGRLGGIATSIAGALVSVLRSIQINTLLRPLLSLLTNVLQGLSAVLPQLLRGIAQVLVTGAPVVLNVLRDLVLTLVDYLANLDFEGILNPVVDGLRDGLMSIVQALPSLAGTIIDTILQGVDRLASSRVFSRILGVLENLISRAIDLLTTSVLPAISQILLRLSSAVPRLLGSLVDIVMNVLMELPPRLTRLVTQLGQGLAQALPGVVQNLLNSVWNLLSALPGLAWRILSRLPALVARIGPLLQAVIVGVRDVILGIFEGIRRWLVERFPQAAGTINAVFGAIRTVVTTTFGVIQTVVSTVWSVITTIISAIVPVIRWVATMIWEGIRGTFQAIYAVVSSVVEFFVGAWRVVANAASVAWNWIRDNFVTPIGNALGQVGGWFREHFGGAFTWIRETFGGIVDWFQRQIDRIGGAIRTVRSYLPGGSSGPDPAAERAAMEQLTTQLRAMSVQQRDDWERNNAAMAQAARTRWGHIAQLLDETTNSATRSQAAATTAAVNNIAANAQTATAAVTQGAQRATTAVQNHAATSAQSVESAFGGLNVTMPSGGLAALNANLPGPSQAGAAFDQIPTRANRALTQAATQAQTSFTQIDTTAQATASATAAAFEAARDRIVAAFSAIRGTSTGEQGVFAAMRAEATALFTGVATDATTAVTTMVNTFRGNIQTLATEISNIFTVTIADAVSAAFVNAFSSVLMYVQNTFIQRMQGLFVRLIQGVNEMFYRFLMGLMGAMDQTMAYLTQQVAGTAALIARATQAASTIQARMAQATQAAAGTVIDARARNLGSRTATNDDLYNAIMHPDWYENDYKGLFVAKMDDLISAVRTQTRVATGAAGGGARPNLRRVLSTETSGVSEPGTGVPAEPAVNSSGITRGGTRSRGR